MSKRAKPEAIEQLQADPGPVIATVAVGRVTGVFSVASNASGDADLARLEAGLEETLRTIRAERLKLARQTQATGA